MKRFKYDEILNRMKKLNYKIAFPLELKLAPVINMSFALIFIEL